MPITGFTLFLTDFELLARIGVHAFEQTGPQRLVINIAMELEPAHLAAADAIGATLNYDFLRDEIKRLVGARHYNLQETLCRDIVAIIASKPEVLAATVETRKPDVYEDAAAVGCRLQYRKGGA